MPAELVVHTTNIGDNYFAGRVFLLSYSLSDEYFCYLIFCRTIILLSYSLSDEYFCYTTKTTHSMKNVTFVPGTYKVRVRFMGRTVYVGAYQDQEEAAKVGLMADEAATSTEVQALELFRSNLSALLNPTAPTAPAPAMARAKRLTFTVFDALPVYTYDEASNVLRNGDVTVDAARYTSIHNDALSVDWLSWYEKSTGKFFCKTLY